MQRTYMFAALSLVLPAVLVISSDADARSRKHRALLNNAPATQDWSGAWQNSGGQRAWWTSPSSEDRGSPRRGAYAFEGTPIDSLIASHAAASGVPLDLARRVVKRESGGNPRAVSKGNYGLMQIRLGTARAMGYTGGAAGLLDPATNMTYAMKYLAGAHRAAGGNHDRAVALYARGYYYDAKRQGWSPYEMAGTETALAAGYGAYASMDARRAAMPPARATLGAQIVCDDRGCSPAAAR
jgi:soluble lytic murein transglycosylase-like protein